MGKFVLFSTNYLITKLLKEEINEKVTNPESRKKYAYLEAIISIIMNLFLTIVKGILGILINSISLIADAVHTASDVLTSIVVIMGFKFSTIPPDEKHPHGHGRIEFISTLIISILLLAVGVKFAISSYERFIDNTPVAGSYLVVAIMIFAALAKEWLSQFSIILGERIGSSTLIADAWHHRTDAIASLMVAVAILASQFGYYRVDAILGFGVSLLIIYTGISIFSDSTSKIIGEIDSDELDEIRNMALSVDEVINTHDICIHDYGVYKDISLHIELDKDLTLIEAHTIAEKVENVIGNQKEARVTVHVDAHHERKMK